MSGIKDQVAVLLSKKMDRRDFLKYAAAAGLTAVGAGAIVNSIAGLDKAGQKRNLAKRMLASGMARVRTAAALLVHRS